MKPVIVTGMSAIVLLFGSMVLLYAQREAKREEKENKQDARKKGKRGESDDRRERPRGSQEDRGRQNRDAPPPPQQRAPQAQQEPRRYPQGQAPRVQQRPEHRAPQSRQRQQQAREQPQRTQQQQAHVWQQQRGWQKAGAWQGRNSWEQHRARQWSSDHRTWTQRGGYGGYYVPQERFRLRFGSSNMFRIGTRPVMSMGYPRFEYAGYSFLVVDPWPEYWSEDWYGADDVYIDYDEGYYLYNRRHSHHSDALVKNPCA
ncbi:MAG: hypothetical protein ABIZ80_17490 [Bryobacteraceae bacterium]